MHINMPCQSKAICLFDTRVDVVGLNQKFSLLAEPELPSVRRWLPE